jgi:hypothetical protein
MKAGFDSSRKNGVYLATLVYRIVYSLLKKRFFSFDSAARAPILSVAVEFPVLTGCEVAG